MAGIQGCLQTLFAIALKLLIDGETRAGLVATYLKLKNLVSS